MSEKKDEKIDPENNAQSHTGLLQKVDHFPQEPGVYLMKGEGEKIIYVGKAINLRSRVKSYFKKEAESRYQISFLMKRVRDIDFLITTTEKEALLLENSLIKKHKPKYNIHLKDDKSYVSIKLLKHDYPRLFVTRKVVKDGSLYFGPYSSADACRETVDFIYKNFKLRTCRENEFANRSRPCLEYQIKRCTAPCVNYVTKEQYALQIEPVKLFLQGKNSEVVHSLQRQMGVFAEAELFEEAASVRDLIKNMETTLEKQRVVSHAGGEQDIVVVYRREERGMIACLMIRNGDLIDSRYYPFNSLEDDASLIENFLTQHYLENAFIPDEILVSTDLQNVDTIATLLTERRGKKVTIRHPQKGDKKEFLELATNNAQSHFEKRSKKEVELEVVLERLAELLELPKIPHHMECYDISNNQGIMATASQVVFVEGRANKGLYRHYRIKQNDGPNDYAMMKEVLMRRLDKKEGLTVMPDLLIMDGGKGQLSVAVKVLEDLKLAIPVISIAKGQGIGARAKGLWKEKKEEEIYLPGRKNPVILKRGSAELMLLQQIRDESHRFAITYHRNLMNKSMRGSKKK